MDEFEKRLKRDADAIEAKVSPELRNRIDATLRGTEPIRVAESRRDRPTPGLWWASTLTGVAAVLMIIVLVNWGRPVATPVPETPVADMTVPPDSVLDTPPPLLDIRTADFTSPLEEELDRLQSDLEKARESVKKDLDFTF
jgi:hypothetical protein